MPHSVPKIIKLESRFNQPIKPSKKMQDPRFVSARDRSGRVLIGRKSNRLEGVMDKNIVVYRMWYRYLQLALELEQKNVKLITKEERVPLKKPMKDAWGHVRKSKVQSKMVKVKVNKKVYKDWDLDIVSKVSFNDWWSGNNKTGTSSHKELFYEEQSKLITSKDQMLDTDQYHYIQIDKRKRVNDAINELRQLLKDTGNRKVEEASSLAKYQIYGQPNIDTLMNRYNALIVRLTTDMNDIEILTSKILRGTKFKMEGYRFGSGASRTMRDLLFPAKIAVLSVCDGYFVYNPNKNYA